MFKTLKNNQDFKKIKSSFCFMDETGLINSKRDKFFAIGIIKIDRPEKMYNEIRKIRQRFNYKEELKWAKIDREIRFKIAIKFFEVFLREKAEFSCIILDKDKLDFKKHHNNNMYKAYRSFTIALLKIMLGQNPDEIIIILADDYFSPEGSNLEETIRKFTNDHYKKFVIGGVCQIDSRSNDILQTADLIMGAIVYDLKKQNELIDGGKTSGRFKRKFVNYLYQKLSVKNNFFENGRSGDNYIFGRGKIKATIFDCDKSKVKKYQCL